MHLCANKSNSEQSKSIRCSKCMGAGFSERKSTEAGFNNEVAILNLLCEHVFTDEVAILNGRKVWFRESKVEIEQKNAAANILSQVQNKASVYRFRSF